MSLSRRGLVTGAAALALFDAVKARGQQALIPGVPGRKTGFQFLSSYPSWVPPTTNGLPTKSYYEFTTDRGYSAGLIRPSSTSDFTISRASVGYDLAATMLFSANQFRRTAAGLLVEGAATNLEQRSTALSTSPWSLTSATSTNVSAPDGTSSAVRLLASNASGIFPRTQIPNGTIAVSSSTIYNFSVYSKYDGVQYNQLQLYDSTGTFGKVFDTQNGLIGATTVSPIINSSITKYGSFYKCSFAFQTGSGATGINTALVLSTSNANASMTGDGVTTAGDLYGAQLELGSFATSLIPTTTTSATRAADAISFTVPAGASQIKYTFDDASTQTMSVSPGAYTIPTSLNRSLITSMAVS